jgi:hypothetical protein
MPNSFNYLSSFRQPDAAPEADGFFQKIRDGATAGESSPTMSVAAIGNLNFPDRGSYPTKAYTRSDSGRLLRTKGLKIGRVDWGFLVTAKSDLPIAC